MIELPHLRWLVFVVITGSLLGCVSRTTTKEFPVAFSPDGKRWQVQEGHRTFVFDDDDGDGLAEAGEFLQDGSKRFRVEFDHREYKILEVIGELKPGDIEGINVVLWARYPLTTEPLRSKPVDNPALAAVMCDFLNNYTFHWSGIVIESSPGGGYAQGGLLALKFPPTLGIEIHMRNEVEPISINLELLDDSYRTRSESLSASWKGKSAAFGNDPLVRLFAGLPGVSGIEESGTYDFFADKLPKWPKAPVFWPLGSYTAPTYYGGVPIDWKGKPLKAVSRDQKINQAKELIRILKSKLPEE
jgi:hypothetical protein